jgi:predicted CoA-binding protein
MSALSILQATRTIAVVGLSPRPERASFRISKYMQAQGYRIIPIHPAATEVLGEKAYPTLTAAAQAVPIDLVNCFRRSEDIPPIAHEAVAIGAKALWLQLGIENDEACAHASRHGLDTVQNLCLKVEHAHWLRTGKLSVKHGTPATIRA